jgi:hypothetical protein
MKVGVCAIIKDCNESYLKEWIEWHQLIGVDYFFIYDLIKMSSFIYKKLWRVSHFGDSESSVL